MYTEFYRLESPPFQLTPDPRFFYGSSVHKRAMAHLTYGLSQGEGFIVITGDVGAGKTTLVGHLLATLDSARFVAANVVTTQLGADDMLRMIAEAFGVPQEGADKATLLARIEDFLASHDREGQRCLLLIDEAQNIPVPALEELRMLSNFHVDGHAPLQSFLLGQPQFRRTLASRDLDQLRQRIIASYHLGPMNAEETRRYILHRLQAVGWQNDPELDEGAYQEIYEQTGGVPRRINVLCSRLLLYGFLEERHHLDGVATRQVAEDLEEETDQILDDSAPPIERSPNGIPLVRQSGGDGPGRDPRVDEVMTRLQAMETRVDRHDRTIRQTLQTLADYLEALSGDLKRDGNG